MTTAVENTAAAVENMTTAVENIAAAGENIVAAGENMATADENMATAVENIVTAVVNMTTAVENIVTAVVNIVAAGGNRILNMRHTIKFLQEERCQPIMTRLSNPGISAFYFISNMGKLQFLSMPIRFLDGLEFKKPPGIRNPVQFIGKIP
jgi:hypothetical protein